MRRKMIARGDVQIEAIESDGLGQPVFMFHGNSSSADVYAELIDSELGKRHAMVAFSFPGHGGSSRIHATEPYISIRQLGQLAAELVQAYGAERYWLVGQSLGGHALLENLEGFPGAAGLLLLSAPPISLTTLNAAFKPDPTNGCLFSDQLDAEATLALARCFVNAERPQNLARVRESIERTDPRFRSALGASLGLGLLEDEHRALAEARCPVALMAGADDQFLEASYYASIAPENLWHGKVHVLADTGHTLSLEAPAAVETLLAELIASTPSASGPSDAADRDATLAAQAQ